MNTLVALAALSIGQIFVVNPQIPVVTYPQVYVMPQPVIFPTVIQYTQPVIYPIYYNYNAYPYYNNFYRGYNPIEYSLYLRMNNLKIAP